MQAGLVAVPAASTAASKSACNTAKGNWRFEEAGNEKRAMRTPTMLAVMDIGAGGLSHTPIHVLRLLSLGYVVVKLRLSLLASWLGWLLRYTSRLHYCHILIPLWQPPPVSYKMRSTGRQLYTCGYRLKGRTRWCTKGLRPAVAANLHVILSYI